MNWSKILHTTLVAFLFFLTAGVLLLIAIDMLTEASKKKKGVPKRDGVEYVLVVSIGYFLVGIFSFFIFYSRLVTVSKALRNIPKQEMPIKKNVPPSVHAYISKGLQESRDIARESQPKIKDIKHPGWGRPGTRFEGINFRATITQTPEIIEEAAIQKSPGFKRKPQMTIQRYIDFLTHNNVIEHRIGLLYVEKYERARFGEDEVHENEYTDFMKLVTLILNQINKWDGEGEETEFY